MPAIVALETSTLTASVALLIDGQLVFEKESGVNSHSDILLSLVDEALTAGSLGLEELSTIAIGAGPGSFTGLRIGMATAKGLCFGAGVSLTPVSSLAALALDCRRVFKEDCTLVSVMDARRKEIFAGFFAADAKGLRALAPEQVMAPQVLGDAIDSLTKESTQIILCGDGALKYEAVFAGVGQFVREARHTPSAQSVALLAQDLPPEDLLASAPTYVRLSEAEIKFPDGNPGGTFSVTGKR